MALVALSSGVRNITLDVRAAMERVNYQARRCAVTQEAVTQQQAKRDALAETISEARCAMDELRRTEVDYRAFLEHAVTTKANLKARLAPCWQALHMTRIKTCLRRRSLYRRSLKQKVKNGIQLAKALERRATLRLQIQEFKLELEAMQRHVNTRRELLASLEGEIAEAAARLQQLLAEEAEQAAALAEAEAQHQAAEQESEARRRTLGALQAEAAAAGAAAERPRLLRRATLPDSSSALPRPCRIGQLAARITMDWCVASRSGGAAKSWDIGTFLASPEAEAAQLLADANTKGEFLLEIKEGAGSVRHTCVHTGLLLELRSPKIKSPPPRLNFFDLLRTSLGDKQFEDVWLVPEAPHFHERALGLDRARDIAPPKSIAQHLRPYQLAGFRWLASLARNGMGAVLADDMGLGKTLQALTLLAHLHENGMLKDEHGAKCPALVVVPPGLLRNWQQELAKWAPQLSSYLYHGPQRNLPPRKGADYSVFLTTYHTVRNDCVKLADVDLVVFSCMVIDEAQCIKNHGAKMTKAVKEVGNVIGHTRIALSGTPIENKVDELHSIFDFVNYGYLGDYRSFSCEFSKIIEGRDAGRRAEKLELLKRLTNPFQMRRLKTDPNILPDLPGKLELQCTVSLTKMQQQLYAAVQAEWRGTMEASRQDAANHQFERRGHVFAMLEKVRRICSHPICLDRSRFPEAAKDLAVAPLPELSGKAARLMELLDDLLPLGEKVLVFVTRKAMLDALREMLSRRYSPDQLLVFSGDLKLQERADVERRFTEEARCQILLITVQCGGIGLNLTAANHVVHYDRCYNPAKESQATDRAHRLGQQRAVCVHRMVTEGTYEERLEEIMQKKQDLSSLTVTRAEDWIADYDDEALFDLFMLRAPTAGAATPKPRKTARSSLLPSPLSEPRPPMPIAAAASSSSSGSGGGGGAMATPSKRPRQPLELGDECAICMDAPSSVALQPCGHRVLCGACAERVGSCPVCRQIIRRRVALF